MHPFVTIATRAAQTAGNMMLRYLERLDTLTIEDKGVHDFVSEVDRMCERIVVDAVQKAYPDHGILAEEGTHIPNTETLWIIDPLDGTTNYLHGFPMFAVSIGVQVRGRLEHAVVFDPLRNEMFSASRGNGAMLDNRRLRIKRKQGLTGALLGTGFPYSSMAADPERRQSYLRMFESVLPMTAGIRRAGSAALDLAYVAAGRLDGYWEAKLKPWDIAAGVLLVQEAGGFVTDFNGADQYLQSGNLIVGAPAVQHELLDIFQAERTRSCWS